MTKVDIKLIQDLVSSEDFSGFDYCDDLMYTFSRLGIGDNRTVRYWMAQELYILLTEGHEALKRHRDDNNWWG
jgi:hypothetical protein